MTLERFEKWLEEARRMTTVHGLAVMMNVTDRTVHRWLAKGIADYECAGYPAGVKYDTPYHGDEWRFYPLACIQWCAAMHESGRIKEPPFLNLLRTDFPRWYAFAHKHNVEGHEKPYPGFSWELVFSPRVWSNFGAWVWLTYICNNDMESPLLLKCPLTPIYHEETED
jgi:hypothetical protein